MALIPVGLGRTAQFYLTGPMPCPYLPGQIERKIFTRLKGEAEADFAVTAALTRAGFRRSHDIVYRTACPACQACVPVRVPVARFRPSRSQRRIMRRNHDLQPLLAPATADPAHFALFLDYQRQRHGDSDMARMSREDYAAMITDGGGSACTLALRAPDDEIFGVMLADRLDDGFSALYSFFSPGAARRSLGTQMILSLIAAAQAENLPYVYLGYWIRQARKMAYKAQFTPQQRLGVNGWEDAAYSHSP